MPGDIGPTAASSNATARPARGDPGDPCRGQATLRQSAHPRRTGGAAASCCVNTVAKLMREQGHSRPNRPGSSGTRRTPTTPCPWPRTSSTDSSIAQGPNDAGSPTSPTSQPAKAGCTSRPSRICTPGWWWAGRWPITWKAVWWSMRWRWPSRRFPGEGLLAHSDRGSQYASDHYQGFLAKHGIECSMSRRVSAGTTLRWRASLPR